MLKPVADITVHRDATGWAFVPHSAKADDFLFMQFGMIGERDLNQQDVELITRRAARAGYTVTEQDAE